MGIEEDALEAERRSQLQWMGPTGPSDPGIPLQDYPSPEQMQQFNKEDLESKRNLYEAAGGTIGGTLGGLAAGSINPALAYPGAVVGAGAGGALTRAGQGREAMLRAAARNAATEAIATPAMNLVVSPAARGISKLAAHVPGLRRISQLLTGPAVSLEPGAAFAQRQLQQAGETLSAGQASKSWTIDTAENMARKSILGGPLMIPSQQGAVRASTQDIYDFARTLRAHPDPQVRAGIIQDVLEEGKKTWLGRVGAAADDLDKVLEGHAAMAKARGYQTPAQALAEHTGVVDTRAYKAFWEEEAAKYQYAKVGTTRIRQLAREAADLPTYISFKDAHYLRSRLGALTPKPGEATEVNKGAVKKGFALVSDAMEDAGNRLPPDALPLYNEFRRLTREGSEVWNSKLLRKTLGLEEPEVLFEAAVKPGRPTNILRLRAALQEHPDYPRVWNEIQGQWFDRALRQSTRDLPNGGKTLDGTLLLQQINKLGPASEKALFGGRGLAEPRQLARTLQLSEKTASSEGIGGVAIQLMQWGAAIDLTATAMGARDPGATTWGSGAIILGPVAIALAFRDPRFVNYLTQGVRAPVGSRVAARAMGQLLTRSQELGILEHPLDEMQRKQAPGPPPTMAELLRRRALAKSGTVPYQE